MKSIVSFAAALCVLAASGANAASLTSVPTGSGIYSIYLQYGTENGVATSINFLATPDVGQTFLSPSTTGMSSGAPRAAGHPSTFRNAFLSLDPADEENPGGLGWNILGATTNTTQVAFGGGPLGGTINTTTQPQGRLFLANVSMPSGTGSCLVQLGDSNSQVIYSQTIPIVIPEPAACGLAGLAMLGFAGLRRRFAC